MRMNFSPAIGSVCQPKAPKLDHRVLTFITLRGHSGRHPEVTIVGSLLRWLMAHPILSQYSVIRCNIKFYEAPCCFIILAIKYNMLAEGEGNYDRGERKLFPPPLHPIHPVLLPAGAEGTR